MRLQQSIDYNTRGILQDIARLNEQKEQKISESRISRQKYKQAQAEILAKEPRETELKHKFDESEKLIKKLKSQIEETEQKRAKLLELLQSFQEEFDDHKSAWDDVHRSTEKARHALQSEQERLQTLEQDLKEIQNKGRSARERLLKVRYLSLKHYFEEVSHRLESAFRNERAARPYIDVKERFQRARETDPGIRELYTTLKEWEHIASSASQASIRQTAEKEHARVQGALERKFPGLFKQESNSSYNGNLQEELFYYEGSEGERSFLMPVTAEHWRTIENDSSSKTEPVMDMLWRIIKQFELDPNEAHFQCRNGLVELVMRNGSHLSKKVNLDLQLHEATLSLVFSPLPPEILESLKYEIVDS